MGIRGVGGGGEWKKKKRSYSITHEQKAVTPGQFDLTSDWCLVRLDAHTTSLQEKVGCC